jgi:transcriptional regulator with PAS, ATPase and Fis domain
MEMSDLGKPEKTGADLLTELEEKILLYSKVPHYVLITGERGTGKTTIAKRLHKQSARANREFVNLNCATLSQELLEAELFGYEKGAFTGANAPKAGLFEVANGGTLFLDEIGEIPFALQAKLLKAVEEKRIRRIGSNAERAVDTRIIAATSANLTKMVEELSFRADLFDRLNILSLETVPLRFQKDKIKDLLIDSLKKECALVGRNRPFEISCDALDLLESYEWHGNFRELHNAATRLAVECFADEIISTEAVYRVLGKKVNESSVKSNPEKPTTKKIPSAFSQYQSGNLISVTFDPKTDDLDLIYLKAAGIVIQHILDENDGNMRRTAQILGATHPTISRIIRKFNESLSEYQHQIADGQNFAMAGQC